MDSSNSLEIWVHRQLQQHIAYQAEKEGAADVHKAHSPVSDVSNMPGH